MKKILSMALVFVICGLAGAQGDKVDPIATWKCEYKIDDQIRTLERTSPFLSAMCSRRSPIHRPLERIA